MKKDAVNKIMIFGTENDVCTQLLGKVQEVFGTDEGAPRYIIAKAEKTADVAIELLEEAVREEKPDILLIEATAAGEEIAPALGIRLKTGVAAHCVDIDINREDRVAFMVPAFGGKVIGEIFIPGGKASRPAIATVKPGTFKTGEGDCRRIDFDETDHSKIETLRNSRNFKISRRKNKEMSAQNIADAELVLCGGFGLESAQCSEQLRKLAEQLGGACGCTRAALDMDWGFEEDSMIGTSGRNIRPKVYVGFGVSGAAHHICGIKDADIIISINTDRNAEVFAASDFKGVFNARDVIAALEKQMEDTN